MAQGKEGNSDEEPDLDRISQTIAEELVMMYFPVLRSRGALVETAIQLEKCDIGIIVRRVIQHLGELGLLATDPTQRIASSAFPHEHEPPLAL